MGAKKTSTPKGEKPLSGGDNVDWITWQRLEGEEDVPGVEKRGMAGVKNEKMKGKGWDEEVFINFGIYS